MDKEKTIKDTISITPTEIEKAKKIGKKIGKTYRGEGSFSGAVRYLINKYNL